MKASEIRELNDADLAARIEELERERFNLRFQGATTQLEDPLRQRKVRKDIARLKTVQAERKAQGGATSAATTAAKSARGKKAQGRATGGTTTKATAAKKAPAKKKAATGAGR